MRSAPGGAGTGGSDRRCPQQTRKETQKFAQEGFFIVLTTRARANASALAEAIREQGGDRMIVKLDLVSQTFIDSAFATISPSS
jgi:short-subunit dehydrogenase